VASIKHGDIENLSMEEPGGHGSTPFIGKGKKTSG